MIGDKLHKRVEKRYGKRHVVGKIFAPSSKGVKQTKVIRTYKTVSQSKRAMNQYNRKSTHKARRRGKVLYINW